VCFFSVTTTTSNVFLFGTSLYEDRDQVVNGIKNLIALLAFHLVAGNEGVSAKLYGEDYGQMSVTLPSLQTPTQSMNIIAYAFLDWVLWHIRRLDAISSKTTQVLSKKCYYGKSSFPERLLLVSFSCDVS
jgi:hypothetical protein